MSPEQARGRPVDRRADVWAFGAVLYEMLTGRRAFGPSTGSGSASRDEGDDVSVTLSRVLQRDPDYTLLPAGVPPRVVRVIEVCLRKDARQRASDIRDVRLALDGAFDTPAPLPSAAAPSRRRERVAWTIASVAAAVAIVAAVFSVAWRPEPAESWRVSTIQIPDGWELALSRLAAVPTSFVIAPDGRSMAMVAHQPDGPNMILIRESDSSAARPLAGTEGATICSSGNPTARQSPSMSAVS